MSKIYTETVDGSVFEYKFIKSKYSIVIGAIDLLIRKRSNHEKWRYVATYFSNEITLSHLRYMIKNKYKESKNPPNWTW